jgi:acyl-CoA thioesterase-1
MTRLFLLFQLSLGFAVGSLAPLAHANEAGTDPRPTLVFFGDSLTAGYGLENHVADAFPGLLQAKIDREGLAYRVVNAGLSGDTTAGGLRRIDWVLRQPVDVFVLELGGNDGLRGLPLATARANLQAIMERVRARNPQVRIILAGMQLPTSMGTYAEGFARLFPELAAANGTGLIPFLLEGVGGVPELNLPDGIHPTVEGHRRIADTVWPYLRPFLVARTASGSPQLHPGRGTESVGP